MSCLNNISYGTGEPREPEPTVVPAELILPSNVPESTIEDVKNIFPVDYRTVSEDLAHIPGFYRQRIENFRKISNDTIDRFYKYAAYFAKVFESHQVPIAIIALSIVESNVTTGATSHVGAAGIWQFMPATARDMGLKISGGVDERRDVAKSTDAAARLLKQFKKVRGVNTSWLLTISSYNYGPGNVQKRYDPNKSVWEIIESFGSEEARNYVAGWVSTCIQLGLISGIGYV